ncbi:TetR/AcrR family transcriptional regulator [Sphingobium tyrosinilyticum]|uniref:TetR/AcrR family transcriptional regulator n=1 Tax=Sphingobium tyrosinilyticum TaxID=2715436 RepID=A0ABV9EZH3_9SPHN
MENKSGKSRETAANLANARASASRGSATVEAIIRAAERLWGIHGIEGASLREIGVAAGSANKSPVAYHFSNRNGLIVAICRRREPALEVRRRALFVAAEAEGELGNTLRLLHAVFQPVFEEVDEDGRHTYAAFLRSLIRFPSFDGRAMTQDLTPTGYRVLDLLREQASHLPQPLFDARLRLVNQICYAAITDLDEVHGEKPIDPPLANKIFDDALSASAHLLLLHG